VIGADARPVKDRAAAARRQAADQVGFGHAAANARRMRLAVSTTRAAISRGEDAASRTRQWLIPGLWDASAHGQHQPISGVWRTRRTGWQARTAAGAIGGELCLMQLDQILSLAARAIQAVVDHSAEPTSRLVTTKRMSRPSFVASIRATARRSAIPGFAWWRVSV